MAAQNTYQCDESTVEEVSKLVDFKCKACKLFPCGDCEMQYLLARFDKVKSEGESNGRQQEETTNNSSTGTLCNG